MRLLELRPQIRQNWTALAVAHHLQGDPARAVDILAAFENTLKVQFLLDRVNPRLLPQELIRNIPKLYFIEIRSWENTIYPLHLTIYMKSRELYLHLE